MFKIAKVSAFHKMHGAPTGPGNNVTAYRPML